MRKFILFFSLSMVIAMLFSCNDGASQQTEAMSYHEVQWSPDGQDSIVHVNYVNDQGSQNSFLMNYLLFRTLFSQGGYNNCYNYYTSHPNSLNASSYSNYRTRSTYTSDDNKTGLQRSYTSPSRSTEDKKYSSPSRSTSSPTKTYSSPSRSTSSPTKSYSSPSRSTYSSPARSSSSPSRSYSSPSRSSSSPSRH